MKPHFSLDFRPKLFDTLRNYNKETFAKDLMAGIIVGIVAIPLAIAFGIASGVGPTEGLVTAIFAGFLISALGGSRVQIGGPTGAFIIIIYNIVQDPNLGLAGLAIATIMAGILLVLMGVFKLGTIIKFMPYPIIVGFTAGIAVTIFSTQINDLFGLRLEEVLKEGEKMPGDFIDKWALYFDHFDRTDLWSLGMGVATILIIALTGKISKKIPGSLVAIIAMTAVYWVLKEYTDIEQVKNIKTIGAMPPLPSFTLPKLAENATLWSTIHNLLPPAFTIAMLGAIESLLSAMVADGVINSRHNSNTELIAQGAANIVVPFFGGIPATGAIARTMANINNGGRTPVAGIVHAVVLLLALLCLGDLISIIPMPCMAGVLVVVAYNMSGWRTVRSMCSRQSRSDIAILFITMILTIVFDLTIAIMVGLVLAVVLFVRRIMETSKISVLRNEMELHHDGEDGDVQLSIPNNVEVFEIEGPFFFGVATKFEEMAAKRDVMPIRIVRMRKVTFIDSTGIHNLESFVESALRNGQKIILSGVNEKVYHSIERAGIVKMLGKENVLDHIDKALERAKKLAAELQ